MWSGLKLSNIDRAWGVADMLLTQQNTDRVFPKLASCSSRACGEEFLLVIEHSRVQDVGHSCKLIENPIDGPTSNLNF